MNTFPNPKSIQLPEAGSTNDEAFKHMNTHGDDAALLWTTNQTAGRGSRGRSWLSPKGTGLAMTGVLRCPPFPHPATYCYPLFAAVWLHQALKESFPQAEFHLKWPNDLLLDGRKLAGILCESRLVGEEATVVLGIGLNLGDDPSLASLDRPYATLAELPFAKDPEGIITALAEALPHLLRQLTTESLTDAWLRRCGMTVGQGLRIVYEGETLTGTFAGLSEDGCLLLQQGDQVRSFSQTLQDCTISMEEPCS